MVILTVNGVHNLLVVLSLSMDCVIAGKDFVGLCVGIIELLDLPQLVIVQDEVYFENEKVTVT